MSGQTQPETALQALAEKLRTDAIAIFGDGQAERDIIEWFYSAMLAAAPAPVVPDGYVLVPVEPTAEMMMHESSCQHHAADDMSCPVRRTRRNIWARMLAAAPAHPVERQDQGEVQRLRAALLGIASINPAERGIEWAKSYASDGLKGAGSELYARWLDTFNEAEALRAENARLRQALQRLVTTHCAAATKNNATDAELEQYLSSGIAQIEGERDRLADELAAIKGQEPVAIANKGNGVFWVKWTDAGKSLRGPGIKLYALPPASHVQEGA